MTMGRMDSKTRLEYAAPCTANVYLTVQGTRGSTAPLLLSMYQSGSPGGSISAGSGSENPLSRWNKPLFSPGCTDEFEVRPDEKYLNSVSTIRAPPHWETTLTAMNANVINNAGREPNSCRPNPEYHQSHAPFFIPSEGSR